jgi:hypothetical protein
MNIEMYILMNIGGSMSKVRIPLDVESYVKQDFVDRIESHRSMVRVSKVKINPLLNKLMHYVISLDEFELSILLSQMSKETSNYQNYIPLFDEAENDGLFEGLNIKRGNPRQKEIYKLLMECYMFQSKSKEEVREILIQIDKKMKSETMDLFTEDLKGWYEQKRIALKKYDQKQ